MGTNTQKRISESNNNSAISLSFRDDCEEISEIDRRTLLIQKDEGMRSVWWILQREHIHQHHSKSKSQLEYYYWSLNTQLETNRDIYTRHCPRLITRDLRFDGHWIALESWGWKSMSTFTGRHHHHACMVLHRRNISLPHHARVWSDRPNSRCCQWLCNQYPHLRRWEIFLAKKEYR